MIEVKPYYIDNPQTGEVEATRDQLNSMPKSHIAWLRHLAKEDLKKRKGIDIDVNETIIVYLPESSTFKAIPFVSPMDPRFSNISLP